MIPITHEGYRLMHEGTLALSQVEHNGFKIDEDYLEKAIDSLDADIRRLTEGLRNDRECRKVYRLWKRRFGVKTNLGSHSQLGTILFDVLKIKRGVSTSDGEDWDTAAEDGDENQRWKTDKEVLEDIDLPFVKKFREVEKLKKARSTYLGGIQRETDSNGFLHPVFNLHIARTYRSSCSDPNNTNVPIRDADVAALIRPCYIPRHHDWQIAEYDFSGIEVKVSGCYNKDPKLLKYIRDKTTDMHRDMAMQCYILTLAQVTKDARYCAKNKFVFPEFYGDWYISCARSLWVAIDRMGLKTAAGTPLKKHLRKHGIKGLGDLALEKARAIENGRIQAEKGTFIRHIQDVERDFWDNRFKVYSEWKWDWYNAYLEKGYFDTLTGFRCMGLMNRKQCVNYPIQGSAFHCLLWCLIRIQKLLKKYHMKTLLIGEIHDSLLADVAKGELKDYLELAHQVMTEELLKHWKWIIVPMEAECEVAPPGESWFKKQKVSLETL